MSIWEVDGAGEVGGGGWAQSEGAYSSHHKSVFSAVASTVRYPSFLLRINILEHLAQKGSRRDWQDCKERRGIYREAW